MHMNVLPGWLAFPSFFFSLPLSMFQGSYDSTHNNSPLKGRSTHTTLVLVVNVLPRPITCLLVLELFGRSLLLGHLKAE